MKNILLYTSNDNNAWIDKTVNSINSFFHFNPERISDTSVILLTEDKSRIDLSKIKSGIRYEIIDRLSYDYSSVKPKNIVAPLPVLYRFEVFGNPVFDDVDTVLSLDGDTVVLKNCGELFNANNEAFIGFTREKTTGNFQTLRWQVASEVRVQWYCNMGFMLFTPKLFGKDMRSDVFSRCIDLCRRHSDFFFPDQDALTTIFNMDRYSRFVKFISGKYNHNKWDSEWDTVKDEEAVIRHYADEKKKDYKLEYLD